LPASAASSSSSAACGSISTTTPSKPVIGAPVTVDQSLTELVQQIKTEGPGDGAAMTQALSKLTSSARSDPTIRSKIIERYKSERDPAALSAFATVISTFSPQEIQGAVMQLAQGDASQRANAFRLLAVSPLLAASSQAIIQQALNTERDVNVLSQAVSALGSRFPLDPAQSQTTLARLSALAEHSDPNVRSESLRVLAQWDKKGDLAESEVYKVLTSGDPERRTEAINVVGSSGLKSDRVKTALLNIIGNDSESSYARISALSALERFPLTQQEYALHSRLTTALIQPGTGILDSQGAAQPLSDPGGAGFSPFMR
jgi:hypothetical protein